MIRAPFSELLTTIRHEPSARCRSLSEGFPARAFDEPEELKSSVRSGGDVTSNIGFHQLRVAPCKNDSPSFQTTIVLVESCFAGSGHRMREVEDVGAAPRLP